jgi:adenosylcobinamide kinase/adenosylcobinamide-phosphate guanylyltransferase
MEPRLRTGATLILGGARSGKSSFAERLIEESGLARVYLATGQAGDEEMRERIANHRQRRGSEWRTIEEPLELAEALRKADQPGQAILVDCLTLWLSNLLHASRDIAAATSEVARATGDLAGPVVFVANEVGLGIVPDNALARRFRDEAGVLNQEIARVARTVYFVAAGLPLVLKQD